jgi:hypothetical protein
MQCRHCRKRRASRPRQLCRLCYNSLAVRLAQPPVNIFGRRGVGLENRCRMPAFPTGASPGSPEKIAVFEERARQGVQLFHPLDATEWQPPALAGAG